jgi:hypothetical protein
MNPLQLEYTNGENQQIHLPRGVRWDDDSELQIDLILEDVRKRPAKIQNDAHEEIYKEKIGKIRLLEKAIKKEVNDRSGPIHGLLKLITSTTKPYLQSLATEGKDILDEITHWESQKRIGLALEREKAQAKIASEAEKLTKVKTPKEKAAIKKKIRQYEEEGGISNKAPKSHGVALVKRWKGKLVDPVLFFKSKYRNEGFIDCTENQHKINEHCKEIERNGGKITSQTLPGIELTEETYSQWRG